MPIVAQTKWLVAAWVAINVTGCNRGVSLPDGFPIQGTLKVGGRPYGNVVVEFVSLQNPEERYAGCTDPTGRFLVVGQDLIARIPTQTYQVTLRQVANSGAFLMASPELLAELPEAPNSVIPSEYSDLETTPLVIDVPSEDGRYDISIRSE